MNNFKHFICTRFHHSDPNDLNKRMAVFREFSVPAMNDQLNGNFTWLFKTGHFEKIHDSIAYGGSTYNMAHQRYWNILPLAGKTDWVLMTRFDTDDSIHPDFTQNIHDIFNETVEKNPKIKSFIIDFHGFRYDKPTNQAVEFDYYSTKKCSMFLTLCVKRSFMRGYLEHPYSTKHNEMHNYVDLVIQDPRYRWIQVIHKNNMVSKQHNGYKVIDRSKLWI